MNKTELTTKKQELENELKKVNEQLNNFEYNEKKELYGGKFDCEHCKYSAVCYVEEYTLCGAFCEFRGACEKYEPDNKITLLIKQLESFRGRDNQVHYGYISDDTYLALKCLVGNIFDTKLKDEKEKKIIDILQILYGGEKNADS